MIISTVRSMFVKRGGKKTNKTGQMPNECALNELGTPLNETSDGVMSGLGFLVNEKRFNVAITRAKFLLIVLGDARLLKGNSYWRELIRFAHVNGMST